MIVKGYIFDYGGTLDTGGCHWGKMLWHAYQHIGMSVSEQQFREAYVHAERTLGKDPIIQPNFTFRQTLEAKIRLQLEYLSQAPSYCSHLTSSIMDDVYAHTAHSHKVLQQIPQPKVLVSNFYVTFQPSCRSSASTICFSISLSRPLSVCVNPTLEYSH